MQQTVVELLKYAPLSKWKPVIGDMIFYHGLFWNRWVGVIAGLDGINMEVVKEGLLYLLVTMQPNEQQSNKIIIPISEVKSSVAGKYAVIQNGVTYVDG